MGEAFSRSGGEYDSSPGGFERIRGDFEVHDGEEMRAGRLADELKDRSEAGATGRCLARVCGRSDSGRGGAIGHQLPCCQVKTYVSGQEFSYPQQHFRCLRFSFSPSLLLSSPYFLSFFVSPRAPVPLRCVDSCVYCTIFCLLLCRYSCRLYISCQAKVGARRVLGKIL